MFTGTTKSGFSYEVDEEIADDYELVEAIGETEDNPFAISKVLKMLLGESGTEELKNHCKDDKGRVRTSKIHEEIIEILSSFPKTKN